MEGEKWGLQRKRFFTPHLLPAPKEPGLVLEGGEKWRVKSGDFKEIFIPHLLPAPKEPGLAPEGVFSIDTFP